MSLLCSWATPGDLPAVRNFLVRTFGPGSVQTAPGRFDWLCAAHPRGLHVSLCRDDGEIAGVCCHLPVRIALGERDVAGAYGIDFMVAPAWRNRGIGQQLLALRLERFPVGLSTGQSPAMAALYRKAGGQIIGAARRALAVRRPPWRGAPRALARDWTAWGLGRARGGGGGARRPLELAAAATRLETGAARLRPDEAGARPDAADFTWRYGGPIYKDHLCWELTAGGEQGLLVTRRAGGEEIVVDLHAPPRAQAALLRAAVATSAAPRLSAAFYGPRLAAAFSAAGWLVRPAAAQLVAMSGEPDLAAALASRPWAMFAGESDLDLLRPPPGAASA